LDLLGSGGQGLQPGLGETTVVPVSTGCVCLARFLSRDEISLR
jgi:hypothetical protein